MIVCMHAFNVFGTVCQLRRLPGCAMNVIAVCGRCSAERRRFAA